MTFQTIKDDLASAGKPASDAQVFRYMRRLKIKPVGALTIPRQYPDTASDDILRHLGLCVIKMPFHGRHQLVPLAELKRTARKARGAR